MVAETATMCIAKYVVNFFILFFILFPAYWKFHCSLPHLICLIQHSVSIQSNYKNAVIRNLKLL